MNKYMQAAKDMAEINANKDFVEGGPFGAVIVKDNKIIATGKNNVLVNNDPTAHAEITAIRNACKVLHTHDLSGCVLYTSCYPCPMCLSAIVWANIKQVYYGNTKEDAANIGFRDDFIYDLIKDLGSKDENTNKTLVLECIDRESTITTFNKFLDCESKKIY